MTVKSVFWLLVTFGLVANASAQQAPTYRIKDILRPEDFRACGLRKLTPTELNNLDRQLSIMLQASEQLAKEKAATNAPADKVPFQSLLGGYIAGAGGEFLGKISTNSFEADSILNDVGQHGSEVGSASIFNSVGKYGSSVSADSAFNDIASSPPKVFDKNGQFIAHLTTNTLKTPRLDPTALVGWLKSQK